MKLFCVTVALVVVLASTTVVQAGEGHDHHNHNDASMKDMSHHGDNMFLVKKEIDGYAVSFHVMESTPGMDHGGSHNFMIKVEKDGKVLNDVVINSKVIHPNGQAETKGMMKMGDWYMAGYDLGHAGQHQLMILFKTSDGSKHSAGVYYPTE